jgi:dTDP-4-amino-4,6-dideoxygalactose transaminase
LPSEIIAAFLYAQLENLERIQKKRLDLWQAYDAALKMLTKKGILLPYIPEFATNNAHMYYLVCNNPDERTKLIEHLKKNGIHAVFHYQSLHNSPYYSGKNKRLYLPQADRFSDCLLRLPLYYELTLDQVNQISEKVKEFYEA